MKCALTRNNIVAAVVAAVAIGGVVVALAADRPAGPLDTNQGANGKADMVSPDPARELHRAFKSAAAAAERRDLVMKACENRVISSRMSLDDLKNLFGDSPMFTVYPLDQKTGKQSALLSFSPPEPAPATGTADQKSHDHDWYMWFFFEHDDLKLYYLTNYGK